MPVDGSGIWPTAADLVKARRIFRSRESRDVLYRAATYLVEQALEGRAPITLSEALAVLLQTWNRAYYQYRPPGPDHLDKIDAEPNRYRLPLGDAPMLWTVRRRRIGSSVS